MGHTLGLAHEFDTCGQNSILELVIDCTGTDPTSVMNYPQTEKRTMDHYSPKDVEWLRKVYKGTGTTAVLLVVLVHVDQDVNEV